MNQRLWTLALAFSAALVVPGCGGDDADPNAPVSLFPLQGALKTRLQTGATENFVVSGACNGTAKVVTSPAEAASFEGMAVKAQPQATTYHFSNCVPVSSVVAGAVYYDANQGFVGDMTTGQEYSKVTTAIQAMPLLVAVGDEREYARLTVYADSSKATTKGHRTHSYRVQADGPRSAFVTLTAKGYDVNDVLLYTEAVKYRVTADRTLAMVGIEAQYGVGAAGHFVYTLAP